MGWSGRDENHVNDIQACFMSVETSQRRIASNSPMRVTLSNAFDSVETETAIFAASIGKGIVGYSFKYHGTKHHFCYQYLTLLRAQVFNGDLCNRTDQRV